MWFNNRIDREGCVHCWHIFRGAIWWDKSNKPHKGEIYYEHVFIGRKFYARPTNDMYSTKTS